MRRRVLIIGGGIAGLTASLEAAQAGADVTILQAGQGAHHLFSGCIDVLAYPDPDGPPAENPLVEIVKLTGSRPGHPYAKVGAPMVREALTSFIARLDAQGLVYHGSGETLRRVATALGTIRLTGLVPDTMHGDPSQIDAVCNVGFFRNFAEGMIAAELGRRTGRAIAALSYGFEQGRRDAVGIAGQLCAADRCTALGEFLKELAPGKTVAIPNVLDADRATDIKRRVEEIFGGTLLEMPGLPPGLAGVRMIRAMRRTALDAGVRIISAARAVGARTADGLVRGVWVKAGANERMETADAYVLAAGHLVTGGLVSDRYRLREPIFNLPVRGWDGGRFFAEKFLTTQGHPALSAGVEVDEHLRPLGESGPLYENLFACGDILAGFDPYRERSGGGVALATGTVAGRRAAGVSA
ncbi:MAG TPA: anaerobic glycerol-3-phosphate dehydrogenase subunit GlpB [bacterium]|nr:anaerobic glycerol-3-phosphate dehydrogenase subunit GlpB [bacterium]